MFGLNQFWEVAHGLWKAVVEMYFINYVANEDTQVHIMYFPQICWKFAMIQLVDPEMSCSFLYVVSCDKKNQTLAIK